MRFPAFLFTVTLILASSACDAAGLIPYGSRAGMNVTIIEMRDLDTAKASIRVEHTRDNAKAYCVEYELDKSEQCLERTLREVRISDVHQGKL